MSPLKEDFQSRIRPELAKGMRMENVLGAPQLKKIVVNMGVGEAAQNSKELDAAQGGWAYEGAVGAGVYGCDAVLPRSLVGSPAEGAY